MSPPANLSFKGQATMKQATVKWSIINISFIVLGNAEQTLDLMFNNLLYMYNSGII